MLATNHVLVLNKVKPVYAKEVNYLKHKFCGSVFTDMKDVKPESKSTLYFAGDASTVPKKSYVIVELSYNIPGKDTWLIKLGELPIDVHGVGVYFRRLFNDDVMYHNEIAEVHKFQELTESNKEGKAYRTGLYITDVTEVKNKTYFNLLRCSTNLDGPTEGCGKIDDDILDAVDWQRNKFLPGTETINHVLAQIYHNKIVNEKSRNARISEHSDKTKDMPEKGVIAFCTFYENYSAEKGFVEDRLKCLKPGEEDPWDFCYKGRTSALTKLRFRLKPQALAVKKYAACTQKFDVTLYPNSVFLLPLEMNQIYTHAIIPSTLPIDKLPTRMGYVARCSNTKAVFKNGTTYIRDSNGEKNVPLVEPDAEGVKRLKDLYRVENLTIDRPKYEGFYFSLNRGDYTKPIYRGVDEEVINV